MQEYNILLTQESIHDIADITEYIEIRFGSVCADRFQARLKKEITQLSYMGGMFCHTQIFYKGHAIHQKLFPPSIIFYIIKELFLSIKNIGIISPEFTQIHSKSPEKVL